MTSKKTPGPTDKKIRAAKAPQPYQRPRGGGPRSLSDLMPEIGRAAFRRFGFVQSSVVSRWPEIVGSRYADVSLPESIRFPQGRKDGGTLNLLVSGAHATLMQHIAPEIIERVNRFFGYNAISQIKFRQGTLAPPPRHDPVPASLPMLKPVPLHLGDGLRDIGDPELNRVLASLAAKIADKDTMDPPLAKVNIKGKIS